MGLEAKRGMNTGGSRARTSPRASAGNRHVLAKVALFSPHVGGGRQVKSRHHKHLLIHPELVPAAAARGQISPTGPWWVSAP